MHKQLSLPALPEDDFKQKTSERLDVLPLTRKLLRGGCFILLFLPGVNFACDGYLGSACFSSCLFTFDVEDKDSNKKRPV